MDSVQQILCHLPDESLSCVASYLPRPSRALFATAINSARDNGLNSAILGLSGDVLDFGEMEKNLAAKITDDDLQDILICTNANTKLRKLKLRGCINITGEGLTPLRWFRMSFEGALLRFIAAFSLNYFRVLHIPYCQSCKYRL